MKQSYVRYLLLLTVVMMEILSGAEVDLFVPSFPELRQHFNLSPFWVEALLSVNFIGYCLGLGIIGVLADRFERKSIIIIGLLIFVLGSVFCAYGGLYELLLIGRFLQGLGVAAPAVLGFIIIADTYDEKQQQYLIGMLNGLINVAIAGAPVLGSYIAMHYHWQGNFTALLVLGVITLVMTVFCISSHKPIKQLEVASQSSYAQILQSKPLMLMIVSIVCFWVPYWIFLGMSSLLYIEGLGVSLKHYGYYQGAWALTFALGSVFIGLIVNICDPRMLLRISLMICTVGFAAILLITYFDSQDPLMITLAFLPFSFGSIIPTIIVYPMCLSFMPQFKARIAAIIQGARLIITAIGLEITGLFYKGSFQSIGIIICIIISIAIFTFYLIIKDYKLMKKESR